MLAITRCCIRACSRSFIVAPQIHIRGRYPRRVRIIHTLQPPLQFTSSTIPMSEQATRISIHQMVRGRSSGTTQVLTLRILNLTGILCGLKRGRTKCNRRHPIRFYSGKRAIYSCIKWGGMLSLIFRGLRLILGTIIRKDLQPLPISTSRLREFRLRLR